MFNLHRFYRKAPTFSESDSASAEKSILLEDSEKARYAIDYVPSSPSKSCTKQRKLSSVVKLLLLIFGFAFALFSGQTIRNYATLGYKALLRSSKANHHVGCGQGAIIAAPPLGVNLLDRTGFEASCSTWDLDHQCGLAIDSKGKETFWQSQAGASHWIEIDLKKKYNVQNIAVTSNPLTRDGMVLSHRVETASEKGKWELAAFGLWRDDPSVKNATFEPRPAQFVRLIVLGTTGNQKFVAISDLNIYAANTIPSAPIKGGRWGVTLNFPLVPVTAFLNPITQVLITMASDARDIYNSPGIPKTYVAIWDPKKGTIVEETLSLTGHNMFCPGTSYDESGRVFVTGGSTPKQFSIYDSQTKTWSNPKDSKGVNRQLALGRGYQGQTFLANGKTFMIGGTWSGGGADKDGEIFDSTLGWTILTNVKANNIKMDIPVNCTTPNGVVPCINTGWQQHHPWLFSWKNDSIFHAGPSKQMNWISTAPPSGAIRVAGFREDKAAGVADGDAVCGITSMYDAENGVILTAGGAPNYHYWKEDRKTDPKVDPHRKEATNNAFEIKLGGVQVDAPVFPTKVASMKYQRIFANGIVLPNGETLVVGGQRQGEPFHDATWVPTPEIYSPDNNKTWREGTPNSIPRPYHSWAVLLADATVLVGGGGLNWNFAEANHYDAQIYHPSYLFTLDGKTTVARPQLSTVGDQVEYKLGETITFTSNVVVDRVASLIRYGAVTHSLNNDMRRIKLAVATEGNAADKKFFVTIPADPGVTLPGYWMLFVLQNGVPSVAKTVRITVSRSR